jgi:hypothetical protein
VVLDTALLTGTAAADMPSFARWFADGRRGCRPEFGDLTAYCRPLGPDNPNPETRPEQLAEGGQLFAAARCHPAPGSPTARRTLTLAEEIDTLAARVFATPPYLHDGSARTLRQVFSARSQRSGARLRGR